MSSSNPEEVGNVWAGSRALQGLVSSLVLPQELPYPLSSCRLPPCSFFPHKDANQRVREGLMSF